MRYLAMVAVAALLSLALTQPLVAQQSFEASTEISIRVDARGNAAIQYAMKYPPSLLANALRPIYKIMENVVKTQTIEQVGSLLAAYGWEMKNPKCEISGLEEGQTLQVLVSGEIAGIARRSDNRWTISFELVDPEEDAKKSIEMMNNARATLLALGPGVELDISQKIAVILPKGVEIANAEELAGLGTWRIDYGGGTYQESTLRFERVDGRATVAVDTEAVITTENITITPEELLEKYKPYTIEYVGTPEEEGPSYALYGAIAAAIVVLAAVAMLLRRR